MTGIVSRLQRILNSSSSLDDIDVVLATYLMKRMIAKDFDFSIVDVAEECFTSNATVSRFVRRIGYKSFNDMRYRCMNDTESREVILDAKQTNGLRPKEDQLNEYVEGIHQALMDQISTIDFTQIDALCELIYNSSNVYFFGSWLSGQLAEDFQHTLLLAGKYINYYPGFNERIEVTNRLEPGDVVVVFSQNGSFVMNSKDVIFQMANSQATCVLVTQNPSMKYVDYFNHVLTLGSQDSRRIGRYKLLLMTEILAQRYIEHFV